MARCLLPRGEWDVCNPTLLVHGVILPLKHWVNIQEGWVKEVRAKTLQSKLHNVYLSKKLCTNWYHSCKKKLKIYETTNLHHNTPKWGEIEQLTKETHKIESKSALSSKFATLLDAARSTFLQLSLTRYWRFTFFNPRWPPVHYKASICSPTPEVSRVSLWIKINGLFKHPMHNHFHNQEWYSLQTATTATEAMVKDQKVEAIKLEVPTVTQPDQRPSNWPYTNKYSHLRTVSFTLYFPTRWWGRDPLMQTPNLTV